MLKLGLILGGRTPHIRIGLDTAHYSESGWDTAQNTTYYSESGRDTAQENVFRCSQWGGVGMMQRIKRQVGGHQTKSK